MDKVKQPHKTKNWEIFFYTFNTVSSNGALMLMGYYMFFTQNVLGLAASVVGIIATLMRVWDGVTDPIIGLVIDKTSTRFGKFRPFIAASFFLMSIPMIFLFNTPEEWGTVAKYAYTAVLYAIYIIGYTFQTVSTRAAQAILTKDPKQRPLFAQFQMITNGVSGAILPLVMTTIMAPRYEQKMLDPQLWKDIVWVYVAVMGVSTLLAIIGIRRCDVPENFGSLAKQQVSLKDTWNVLKGNRAIQMLVVAASTDKLASLMMSSVSVYIFSNLILNNALSGTYGMIRMIPSMLLSVVLINFARKYGLKKPFVCFTWASMILLIIMLVIGARPETAVLFLVVWALQQCLTSSLTGMVNPMIADCADYESYRSGKFVPGIMGTIFTFVDKCISAFGSTLVGFALTLAGVGSQKLPTDTWISDKFYWTIMLIFCVPLILGHLATIIAMHFYPLTEEKMVEVQAALRERKEKEEAQAAAK